MPLAFELDFERENLRIWPVRLSAGNLKIRAKIGHKEASG
jgi:hypothetical protein